MRSDSDAGLGSRPAVDGRVLGGRISRCGPWGAWIIGLLLVAILAGLESYISDHSDARFSHSLCQDCMRKLFPGEADTPVPARGGDQAETGSPV